MRKEKLNIAMVFLLSLCVAVTGEAFAQMGHGMKHGQGQMMGGHGKKGHMGVFGPNWKDTLTDEQKAKIDKMHLALKKELGVIKAKKKLKKAELSAMVIQDNPDMKEINAKIDEVLNLKREIMRKKYAHMIEMRMVLTPEQRVSFDMGALSMGGKRKGHGKMGH